MRTIRVLRDIESPKDHDCFLAAITVSGIKRWVFWMRKAALVRQSTRLASMQLRDEPLVHPYDAPTPSKSFIRTAVEYTLDAHLPECRGTHDAGFDGDIKCRIRERVCPTRE